MAYRMTDVQMAQVLAFDSDWAESRFEDKRIIDN
jgi:hypothetical protein